MPTLRVGVLISLTALIRAHVHRAASEPGTNFAIVAVTSNNSSSVALTMAGENRIPARHLSGVAHPDPAALDDAGQRPDLGGSTAARRLRRL